MPNEIAKNLQLNDNEHLFFQNVSKAKWYHMLSWKEMSATWNMLPTNLQQEIARSGIEELPLTPILFTSEQITSEQWQWNIPEMVNANVVVSASGAAVGTGVTSVNLTQQRKIPSSLLTN